MYVYYNYVGTSEQKYKYFNKYQMCLKYNQIKFCNIFSNLYTK